MIPIVALIGRTNVGKSTLFNALTKTRNALVANYPGVTRDRQYGYCQINYHQKLIIIDTAGLDISLNEIEKKAYEQTVLSIKESNIILFIVDARNGLVSQELEISKKIRIYEKKTILVINKIDGIKDINSVNEFYSLGFKNIQKISASHNQGINTLIEKHLMPLLPLKSIKKNEKKPYDLNSQKDKLKIKVAFIGCPNAGKSTLVNRFLQTDRMITCNTPGTTLDSISTPFEYNKKQYILIDTAGTFRKHKNVNKIEQFSIIKTLQTIEKSNIILLIIDANKKICNQDLSLSDFIISAGKAIVIVINKWDLLNHIEKKELKETIKNKLKFLSHSHIHFISALYQTEIFQIIKSINQSYKDYTRKISTSELTKIMYTAIQKHQPPLIQGRRIKLKYAHLGSSNPPKIIIHGNQVTDLPSPYKRYLINFFYKSLKIIGSPIQIHFKNNKNPYIKK